MTNPHQDIIDGVRKAANEYEIDVIAMDTLTMIETMGPEQYNRWLSELVERAAANMPDEPVFPIGQEQTNDR